MAPDGENIERTHRANGLAALAKMFAEPGGTFVFGYVSAAELAAVILTEGCDAVDELGDNLGSFLSGI